MSNELRRNLALLDLPTRAINCLVSMATEGETVSDLIEDYKDDPTNFEQRFMRTPGGGRATLNAVKAVFDKHLTGFSRNGRIAYVSGADRERAMHALREASERIGGSLARELDTVRDLFLAQTIQVMR